MPSSPLRGVGASVAYYQLACAAGTEREGRFPSWQSPCMVSIVLLCNPTARNHFLAVGGFKCYLLGARV